ncbi:MAG: hypothetical protein AVDCRST_MAG73-2804 [uncultured Thermomicrobiales bacterium]|uniref:Phosphatidic acid phosphatase type 2/haloperoxidase domain-containing protein n=1 Tax=uncultured Thermomicrobiales bacterium TaxID=1645740 RepID=A0A6J4UHB8_9BACT|nr:MAG: hypothetical protein AVDCRST_MAG73-2804 [uncultured Thermomicrobiales bacterium]
MFVRSPSFARLVSRSKVPLWPVVPRHHRTVVVLLLGAVLLTAVAAGPGVVTGDVAVTRAVQGIAVPGAEQIALFANTAGTTPIVVALALALVTWLGALGKHGAALFLLAATAVRAFNPMLKDAFDSPRPTPGLVRITENPSGLGFPSGHVMGVVLFYGALWCLAGEIDRPAIRRLARGAALAMIVATGFGRIYVGAHWPTDVVGGVLWGVVLLATLIWTARRVKRFWSKRRRAAYGSVPAGVRNSART